MAHFAQLDAESYVTQVVRVPESQEHRGNAYLSGDLGLGGNWVQTSYNGAIRGRFAGVGDRYDAALDIFVAPQPHASWILDIATGLWDPPVDYPIDGAAYRWSEAAYQAGEDPWVPIV